jgi:hypothetical protein
LTHYYELFLVIKPEFGGCDGERGTREEAPKVDHDKAEAQATAIDNYQYHVPCWGPSDRGFMIQDFFFRFAFFLISLFLSINMTSID